MVSTPKEFVPIFREAPWRSRVELQESLAGVAPLDAGTLIRLLEMLVSRPAGTDAGRHELRCVAFGTVAAAVPDRSLFVPYVRAVAAADPVLTETLLPLIPAVNSVSDHNELCGLLRHADAAVRRVAVDLLSRLGGRSAFEMVAELIVEPTFPHRVDAIDAVVAMGEHRAVPALESVLWVGSAAEKAYAIRQIVSPACRTKDPAAALRAVATAIADSHESVRIEALTALAAHAEEEQYFDAAAPTFTDPVARVRRQAVMGLKEFRSARAVAALQDGLRRGPNPVRLAVLDVLEHQASAEGVAILGDALGHRQVLVRTQASQALARLARSGRLELARTVLWLLRSPDVNVRRMAAEVAAAVPDPSGELWPKLLSYLYDEDWWVRERVIDSLVQLAGPDLVPHLITHLQDDSDSSRRYYAACVLKHLKAPRAVSALSQVAVGDPDWLVRERAIEAIAALKDESVVPVLVNIMMQAPEQRLSCLEAIEVVGAASAAPHVALLLQAQGIEVDERLAVLSCLRAIDGRSEVNAVRQHLRDASLQVRRLATRILTQWQVELGSKGRVGPSAMDQLLHAVAEWNGDDLILSPGRPPFMKRLGQVHPIAKNIMTREHIEGFLTSLLSPGQLRDLDSLKDVDFSYERPEDGLRFRVNVFQEMAGLSAVFRIVRGTRPRLNDLGLPPSVAGLADLKNGLVLVGGPTGSGKSTTLAALIDHINETSARHVISFEDPIEIVHQRRMSLVNQREVGTHTPALAAGLRATLRQDPDVILVGELRDPSTITFAVTAAETGHLVFGTVHTVSAATTVDRLINSCPPGEHEHLRTMLAGSLRAVVCQYLHTRRDEKGGRVLSVEVMLNNDAIANLMRKGKTFQIPSVIATSREQGMQLMDSELMRLYEQRIISAEDAYLRAANKKDFEKLVSSGEKSPSRDS